MAASRPRGTATSRPIPVRYSVPVSSGMTPKDCWSPPSSGVHLVPNRKSPIGTSPKKLIVSRSSERMISDVVTMETAAAANRPYLTACSPTPRRVRVYASEVTSGRALLRGLEVRLGLGRLLLRQRDDLGGLRDLLLVGDHELHEGLDLRARHRLLARVHEQRTGERLVGAVLDGLGGGLHAAVAGVHADQVELVLRTLVVGEPEVAE